MTSNMIKAKVKQGVHFVREWIQQDSTRFGADSGNEFCSTIKQGKRTIEANALMGFGVNWLNKIGIGIKELSVEFHGLV